MAEVDRFPEERAKSSSERGDCSRAAFDEFYGLWICMGCGYAHKLGDPCPCSHYRLDEDGICRRCGEDCRRG